MTTYTAQVDDHGDRCDEQGSEYSCPTPSQSAGDASAEPMYKPGISS